jgi:hypothetical protein
VLQHHSHAKTEVSLARNIQATLVPAVAFQIASFDMRGKSIIDKVPRMPARQKYRRL